MLVGPFHPTKICKSGHCMLPIDRINILTNGKERMKINVGLRKSKPEPDEMKKKNKK